MIRCVMVHGGGLIVAVGIVEENVRRMKDGKPLYLELGKLLAGAAQTGDIDPGEVSLMVAYGRTHEAILKQWDAELEVSGVRLPGNAHEDARALDEQLRSEGLM